MRHDFRNACRVAALCAVAIGMGSPGPIEAAEAAFTLEDITIEGTVDVPEVLFISGRDQVRFPSTMHRTYLTSAAELASRAPRDVRVIVCWRGLLCSRWGATAPAATEPGPADAPDADVETD